MVELIAQLSTGAIPEAAQPMPKLAPMDPGETKTFSLLMDNGKANMPSGPKVAKAVEVSPLQKTIAAQGTEFHDRFQSLDTKRQALMDVDMSDPAMTMWKSVDFSFESTSLFTHLHLASGLASAVNNSFNSLFKNQS